MTINDLINNLNDNFTVAFPVKVIQGNVIIFNGTLGKLSADLALCAKQIKDPLNPHFIDKDTMIINI